MTHRIARYKKRFLENWFSFNSIGLFFIVCLFYATLLFVKKTFIIDAIAAFEVLNESGDLWVFNIIYSIQYVSIPVFLAWKFAWTSLALWIGSFLFGYRLHFNQLWKLVLLTESWFFLPELVKIIWFTFVQTDPSYADYTSFYPLSIMNFLDRETLAAHLHYPAKAINLFEVGYWFILIIGIYLLSGKKLNISFYIVLSSYTLLFLLWLGFYALVY